MRKNIVLVLLAVALSGCMQTKEHLVINEDESGTYEANIMIPTSTAQMMDSMFSAAMQSAGQSTGEGMQMQSSKSSVDQMLGTKEDLLERAKASGVNIEVLDFQKEKKDDGVYGHYKLKFDNVHKFLKSGCMKASFELKKNDQGNWLVETGSDQQQSAEYKEKIERYQQMQSAKQMNPMAKAMMDNAMRDLKLEFLITLPYAIKENTGAFEKVDERTVRLYFTGAMMMDSAAMEQMFAQSSRAVWDSASASMAGALASGQGKVKVYLKDGNVFEGELIEKTEKYTRISLFGVPITYYPDEISKVETSN